MTRNVWIVEIWMGHKRGWRPGAEGMCLTRAKGHERLRYCRQLHPDVQFRVAKYVRAFKGY